MTKIRVGATVAEAYGFATAKVDLLYKLALIPIAVWIGLNYVWFEWGGTRPGLLFNLAVAAALLAALVPFLTAWHRAVLDNRDPAGPTFGYIVGRAELAYLANLAAIVLICGIAGLLVAAFVGLRQMGFTPNLLAAAVVGGFLFCGALAALVLAGQFTLVLPAAAAGAKFSFGNSWNATDRKAWRTFWVLFLCLAPLAAIAAGLAAAAGFPPQGKIERFIISVPVTVMGFYFLSVAAAALSLLYRQLAPAPARVATAAAAQAPADTPRPQQAAPAAPDAG